MYDEDVRAFTIPTIAALGVELPTRPTPSQDSHPLAEKWEGTPNRVFRFALDRATEELRRRCTDTVDAWDEMRARHEDFEYAMAGMNQGGPVSEAPPEPTERELIGVAIEQAVADVDRANRTLKRLLAYASVYQEHPHSHSELAAKTGVNSMAIAGWLEDPDLKNEVKAILRDRLQALMEKQQRPRQLVDPGATTWMDDLVNALVKDPDTTTLPKQDTTVLSSEIAGIIRIALDFHVDNTYWPLGQTVNDALRNWVHSGSTDTEELERVRKEHRLKGEELLVAAVDADIFKQFHQAVEARSLTFRDALEIALLNHFKSSTVQMTL